MRDAPVLVGGVRLHPGLDHVLRVRHRPREHPGDASRGEKHRDISLAVILAPTAGLMN